MQHRACRRVDSLRCHSHSIADFGVEFLLFLAVFKEVGVEFDFAGLEDGDGGGAAEGEIAFFGAFLYWGVWRVGLVDGSDAGGSNF